MAEDRNEDTKVEDEAEENNEGGDNEDNAYDSSFIDDTSINERYSNGSDEEDD